MNNTVNFDFQCRMVDEELKSFWPDWHVVRRLGGGSFGDVFHITRTNLGLRNDSAMKVIQIIDEAAPTTLLTQVKNNTRAMSESASGIVPAGKAVLQQTSPVPTSVYNEIRIMETLRGAPNIVAIEDFYFKRDPSGSNAARLYIRMELLTSFQELLSGNTASDILTIPEICRFAMDICTALDYCEKNSIIHRDIKPANMFVDRFGNYKVGDFGASRNVESLQMAQTMTGIGTISYMAPEIYNRTAYDHTVDIYALGLVLYQLLNRGRAPFLPEFPTTYTTADIDTANFNRLHGMEIKKLEKVDPEIDAIVRKACAFYAKDRYQTAAEMKRDIERYLRSISEQTFYEQTDRSYEDETGGSITGRNCVQRISVHENETNLYSEGYTNDRNTDVWQDWNATSKGTSKPISKQMGAVDSIETVEEGYKRSRIPWMLLAAGLLAGICLMILVVTISRNADSSHNDVSSIIKTEPTVHTGDEPNENQDSVVETGEMRSAEMLENDVVDGRPEDTDGGKNEQEFAEGSDGRVTDEETNQTVDDQMESAKEITSTTVLDPGDIYTVDEETIVYEKPSVTSGKVLTLEPGWSIAIENASEAGNGWHYISVWFESRPTYGYIQIP